MCVCRLLFWYQMHTFYHVLHCSDYTEQSWIEQVSYWNFKKFYLHFCYLIYITIKKFCLNINIKKKLIFINQWTEYLFLSTWFFPHFFSIIYKNVMLTNRNIYKNIILHPQWRQKFLIAEFNKYILFTAASQSHQISVLQLFDNSCIVKFNVGQIILLSSIVNTWKLTLT